MRVNGLLLLFFPFYLTDLVDSLRRFVIPCHGATFLSAVNCMMTCVTVKLVSVVCPGKNVLCI